MERRFEEALAAVYRSDCVRLGLIPNGYPFTRHSRIARPLLLCPQAEGVEEEKKKDLEVPAMPEIVPGILLNRRTTSKYIVT